MSDDPTIDISSTIPLLSTQLKTAWHEVSTLQLPPHYKDCHTIVIAAMGGSHLGAQVIASAFAKSLQVPLKIVSDYLPPAYISPTTLVIATSYSGTTEEVISFTQKAHEKEAPLIAITSGGTLAQFAQNHDLPLYQFDSHHNPHRIPRYGTGYLLGAQLGLLSRLGYLELTDIESHLNSFESSLQSFHPPVAPAPNPAQSLAQALDQKTLVLISAEHLTGSAYYFKNIFNESAKQFALSFHIPELNHHLLEGLTFPTSLPGEVTFCFLESSLYHPKNQLRLQITKDILESRGFKTTSYSPTTSTVFDQALEIIALGSYTSFYQSTLNQVDPAPNPWVDLLKAKLSH